MAETIVLNCVYQHKHSMFTCCPTFSLYTYALCQTFRCFYKVFELYIHLNNVLFIIVNV